MSHPTNTALSAFLSRTTGLLADIERWSTDLGLRVEPGEVSINEERHGQYQAPSLGLRDRRERQLAVVQPFGESIIGAWGRVDVIGEYGKEERIVYLGEGGPTMTTRSQVGESGAVEERTQKLYRGVEAEGWYWVSPAPIRRAYPLTKEVFADLLGAVSGHAF